MLLMESAAGDATVEAQRGEVVPVRDKEGRLLAPNGAVSKLNEQDWVTVRTPFFRRWFGDWLAAVKKLTGVDATGMRHELNAQWIRHGYRQHKSDADPITVADLKRIPEVLDGWDYVERGSLKDGHPSVRFVKRVNGNLYVVERVFKGSRRSTPRMTQVTIWKEPSTHSPAASKRKPRQRYARSAGKARENLLFVNGRVNPEKVSKVVDVLTHKKRTPKGWKGLRGE